MLLAFLFFIFSMPVWEEDHGPTNWAWLINQIARKIRDLHIHHADTYWLACRTNKKHLSFQLLVAFHQCWGWKLPANLHVGEHVNCWPCQVLLISIYFEFLKGASFIPCQRSIAQRLDATSPTTSSFSQENSQRHGIHSEATGPDLQGCDAEYFSKIWRVECALFCEMLWDGWDMSWKNREQQLFNCFFRKKHLASWNYCNLAREQSAWRHNPFVNGWMVLGPKPTCSTAISFDMSVYIYGERD